MEKETKEVAKTEEKEKKLAEPAEDEELKEEELEAALEEIPEEEAKEETKEEEKEELPPAEEKEEAKPSKEEKTKKKEEEEIVEERIYTVPLGKAWIMPPNKRTPRAVRMLRTFIVKHMKLEAKKEGETEEEALANIREAIELYLEPVEDELFISESRRIKEVVV